MALNEPLKKKKKGKIQARLNKCFFDKEFTTRVQDAFNKKETGNKKEIFVHPFFHTILPDFIQDDGFIEELERELSELHFTEKNNDLYKFHQSKDLKHIKSPHVSAFCDILQSNIRDWLITISDIKLTEEVDVFCSRYEYTDVLLCHDDELEKRRFAYIYYLVPPTWSQQDGGALDLFTSDETDQIQPVEVVKSIIPTRNNFVFFEVTETSFHQVAEILSQEKTRLSVSGWFHGPPLPRQKHYIEPLPPLTPYITVDEEDFYSWINPVYLVPDVQGEISEKFETESEIQLIDFIQKDKYEELKKGLQDSNLNWKLIGPANKRNYYLCEEENQPVIVKKCVQFLQSDAMFLVLSNITGLKLHELAPESDDEQSESSDVNSKETGSCDINNKETESSDFKNKEIKSSHVNNKATEISALNEKEIESSDVNNKKTESTDAISKDTESIEVSSKETASDDANSKETASSVNSKDTENSDLNSKDANKKQSKSTSSTDKSDKKESIPSSISECSIKPTKNEKVSSRCHSEVRQWKHGCYTLAHDTRKEDVEYSLDAVFYIGCSDWKTEYGGFTSYIAKDEDEELLSVTPEENCLALVYKDKKTLGFVKHINHKSKESAHSSFYNIMTVYYE